MLGRAIQDQIRLIASRHARVDIRFRIDEPDVSLTNLGLALETATFAVILTRQGTQRPRLGRWAGAFFGSSAIASLAGAIDHGFLRRDGYKSAHDVVWAATLLAIGASSLALAGFGAELGLRRDTGEVVTAAAAVATAAYTVVVLVLRRDFLVAILAYAPAALFLLVAFARRYVTHREAASLAGIAAVLLAFAAAAVQRLEVDIHERYLGHNALYHLVQAISFALLFAAVRWFLTLPKGWHDPQSS